MKFYYKGKLLRTSKNHESTHAVVVEDEEAGKLALVGCRANRQNAESLLATELNAYRNYIASCREALRLLSEGKTKRWVTYYRGHRGCWEKLESAEHYEKAQADAEGVLAYREKHWKVVELEQR
jgi:hypothetical protein